jgi:hypothetical protein
LKTARAWVLSLALLFAACGPAIGQPLGDKPGYLWGGVSSVANRQAINVMICAPGLDDGYVPQGIAHNGATVLMSGYKSVDPKVGTGPCRVFAVSTASGKPTGYFDMPGDCGHAGGLTMVDAGTVVVADTRTLYKIDLRRALEARHATPALLSVVKLGGLVKGSFIDFDGKDLWVGSSEKTPDKARAFRLSLQLFAPGGTSATVNEAAALSSIPIPTEANGMAFDAKGVMWVAASNSRFGALYRVSPSTGEVLAKHDMVIGIEDLSVDPQGGLWSVSEAGSRRWSKWSQTFPVIFRVDVDRLE